VKTILIAFDQLVMTRSQAQKIGDVLLKLGYSAVVVPLGDYPARFNVFDLSNLPAAEIEEIRALIAEKIAA